MMPTTVSIMGSTGSIGTQAIDVIDATSASRVDPAGDQARRFVVDSLGANRSADTLIAQATRLRPRTVVIGDPSLEATVRDALPSGIEVRSGTAAFGEVAARADVVVNGVVGFAGLGVTIEALGAGKRLALANKESLIAAGPVVAPLRRTPGAELIPVDSEHCAIHQCLAGSVAAVDVAAHGDAGPQQRGVRSIVLTASGGPFRGRGREELRGVTVADALAHPTWSMGPKITVDSSTLMNKGLEVIEAHELFGVEYDNIEVVVHPGSIVHSMATFTDGATLAQLSLPDMRLPITYALHWPRRGATPFGAIDFSQPLDLHFEPPDRDVFRCLDLAFAAGRAGATAPAFLSAANEVNVDAFLTGRIGWWQIGEANDSALQHWGGEAAVSVEDVLEADRRGREVANRLLLRQ
ncbi:MAG: 1-deoxy-D-xylulose-5-phosphate reductoisomerase [Microthrixaceae bacterium]